MTLPIPSPCRGVCKIDEPSQLCHGCNRTIDEITRWSRMSDDQKLATLSACLDRGSPQHEATPKAQQLDQSINKNSESSE